MCVCRVGGGGVIQDAVGLLGFGAVHTSLCEGYWGEGRVVKGCVGW